MRNQHRQSLRRTLSTLSAEIQLLESRCLPAGTVTANVAGGNVTLTGDNQANFIEVNLTAGGLFVRGSQGTTIKQGARLTTDGSQVRLARSPNVTTDLIINLKDGNDSVAIYVGGISGTPLTATIGRNLKINTGRGSDVAEVELRDGTLSVGNEMNIDLDAGNDYLLLDGRVGLESDMPENQQESATAPLHVARLAKINAGPGDDIVGIANFSTGGNLQVETFGGNDTVGVNSARIGGSAIISTGGDDDDVGVAFVRVQGRTNITTGTGDDRVAISNAHSEGNVSILLQQGSDTLAANGVLTFGKRATATLDGGDGENEIDTLATGIESELISVATTILGFEATGSSELTLDIINAVFSRIFHD